MSRTEMKTIKPGTKLRCRWIVGATAETVHRVIMGGEMVFFTRAKNEICRASDYEIVSL